MIWTLIAFGAAFLILRKYAYPQIDAFLQRRADAIAEALDSAEHAKKEADQLVEEYRARLKEAREQADDIVARSRKAADSTSTRRSPMPRSTARSSWSPRARTSRPRPAGRSRTSARRWPTSR